MAAGVGSTPRRSSRRTQKTEQEEVNVKKEEADTKSNPNKSSKRSAPAASPVRQTKKIKSESSPDPQPPASDLDTTTRSPKKGKPSSSEKEASLQAKKLKAYTTYSNTSPFPTFHHPTPSECRLAHSILASLHGDRQRPQVVSAPSNRAGCGDSSSVLDALVRTILSQNTSDKNSTRAKLNMDAVYGGSDHWDAIVAGGQAKLKKAIESGGLSETKSRVILSILDEAKRKYGKYSLDHLFDASDEDAMKEMIAMKGVGPKTASCVLLFCLKRDSFAVDTHVHRITGLLGWHPKGCSREETHAHLDASIPDELKYALHILLVGHGKVCDECKAGGKNTGKCELRKAFRGAKVKGEAGEEEREEELEVIKKEEEGVEEEEKGEGDEKKVKTENEIDDTFQREIERR